MHGPLLPLLFFTGFPFIPLSLNPWDDSTPHLTPKGHSSLPLSLVSGSAPIPRPSVLPSDWSAVSSPAHCSFSSPCAPPSVPVCGKRSDRIFPSSCAKTRDVKVVRHLVRERETLGCLVVWVGLLVSSVWRFSCGHCGSGGCSERWCTRTAAPIR